MENQPTQNFLKDQLKTNPPTKFSKIKKASFLSIPVAVILSAFIFGIGGFYLGRMSFVVSKVSNNEKIQQNKSQSTTTPISTIKTINSQTLQNLLNLLKNENFKLIDKNNMWWVSDDNWSILVEDSESIAAVKTKAYSELENSNSDTSKIIEVIFSYFNDQGYSQNQNNSSSSVTNGGFYDFIRGFENDNEKCLLTVNPDGGSYYQDKNKQMVAMPNITISCSISNSFDTNYKKQIPFLKSMNDRKAVLFIQKSTDIAAKARVNWRRTGSFALFSKKNGYWKMIYRGQDQPSCEILKEYDFPKEIHDSCH